MACLDMIGLEFVDIIVKSNNELVLMWSWSTHEQWIKDDHREQFCWKFAEQLDRRESDSIFAGNDHDVRSATEEKWDMWEDGVYVGHHINCGRSHRREPEWRVAHKNGPEENSEKDWNEATWK